MGERIEKTGKMKETTERKGPRVKMRGTTVKMGTTGKMKGITEKMKGTIERMRLGRRDPQVKLSARRGLQVKMNVITGRIGKIERIGKIGKMKETTERKGPRVKMRGTTVKMKET